MKFRLIIFILVFSCNISLAQTAEDYIQAGFKQLTSLKIIESMEFKFFDPYRSQSFFNGAFAISSPLKSMRMDVEFDGKRFVQSADMEAGWIYTEAGGLQDMDDAERKKFLQSFTSTQKILDDPVRILKNFGITYKLVDDPVAEPNNWQCLEFKFFENTAKVYFSKSSNLLMAFTHKDIKVFFEDYREIKQLMIPHSVQFYGTTISFNLKIYDVTINEEIEEYRFSAYNYDPISGFTDRFYKKYDASIFDLDQHSTLTKDSFGNKDRTGGGEGSFLEVAMLDDLFIWNETLKRNDVVYLKQISITVNPEYTSYRSALAKVESYIEENYGQVDVVFDEVKDRTGDSYKYDIKLVKEANSYRLWETEKNRVILKGFKRMDSNYNNTSGRPENGITVTIYRRKHISDEARAERSKRINRLFQVLKMRNTKNHLKVYDTPEKLIAKKGKPLNDGSTYNEFTLKDYYSYKETMNSIPVDIDYVYKDGSLFSVDYQIQSSYNHPDLIIEDFRAGEEGLQGKEISLSSILSDSWHTSDLFNDNFLKGVEGSEVLCLLTEHLDLSETTFSFTKPQLSINTSHNTSIRSGEFQHYLSFNLKRGF